MGDSLTLRAVAVLRAQPPDYGPRAEFGAAVALAGTALLVGAPSDDGLGANAGAAYAFDVGVQRVYFSSAQYVALEGTDLLVSIYIERDTAFADEPLTVAYATSDLTAKGIDRRRCGARDNRRRSRQRPRGYVSSCGGDAATS